MDKNKREQANSAISALVSQCSSTIEGKINEILKKVGSTELHQRGELVMHALRVLEEELASFGRALTNRAAEFEKTPEAFALVLDAHDELLIMADSFVGEVMRQAGALESQGQRRAQLATHTRWANTRRKLQRQILRHRVAFQAMPSEPNHVPKTSPVKNAGGKPLAAHWDAMWAAIAAQLWNGDLEPKSQKDIKEAMFGWFNGSGIEIGDTAVTQRARQLWQAMDEIRRKEG